MLKCDESWGLLNLKEGLEQQCSPSVSHRFYRGYKTMLDNHGGTLVFGGGWHV